LIARNHLEAGSSTVYIQVTRGVAPRSHRFPPPTIAPTVYVEAKPFSPPVSEPESGARAILEPDQRWARCDLKTTGLLANTLAHQKAFEAGAFEAIFCRDGMLMEGTHSSVLFVREGTLLAPPLTNYILPSITRQTVLELAVDEGIPVLVRPCLQEELTRFQEALIVGTTVEVTPIIQVDGCQIGVGQPGPITQKLQGAFRRRVERDRKTG
jgi:D-alanine transaminase